VEKRWRTGSAPKQEHLWLPEELLLQQAQLLFNHKGQLDNLSSQNQLRPASRATLVLSLSA
jgi:hypothetical protein